MSTRRDGTVVVHPADGAEIRGLGGSARTRARRRGGREGDDAWTALIDDLERDDFLVVEEFEIIPPPARRGRPALAPVEPTVVEATLEPGEGAVVLVERDGVFGWEVGASVEAPRSRGRDRPKAARVRFEISASTNRPVARRRGSRGFFDFVAEKAIGAVVGKVKAVVLKFVAGAVVTGATKILERNLKPGLISMASNNLETWHPVSDAGGLPGLQKSSPRVLLWVHGTFSSTLGSYGALTGTKWGQALLTDARKKYDAVLGFDHSTLAEDPSENAVDILTVLKQLPWKSPPIFHGVAFSRGGLVLRDLIERQLPVSDWGASFEKAVFVGATNAGTELAEPDNWKVLLDTYTNLAAGASRVLSLVTASPIPGIFSNIVGGLGTLAKFLAVAAIDDGRIPGLAAMEPDGDFVAEINRTNPGQPSIEELRYYAITSNFEPRGQSQATTGLPAKLIQRMADGLMDRLMGEANDLVVNTESMTTIDPGTPGYLRDVASYDQRSGVHHLCYFAQEGTVAALGRWLELDSGSAQARPRRTRARASEVPSFPLEFRGADRPPPRATEVEEAERLEEELQTLHLRVIWGDLREVDARAYAVGHYDGLLPERAEAALDDVVTYEDWEDDKPKENPPLGVIGKLTASRALSGDLGRITVLPMAESLSRSRLALVCGMGPSGRFDRSSLRLLQRSLSKMLATLPGDRDLCTVLIGSGDGGLSTEDALRGLLLGFADTIRSAGPQEGLDEVMIVEYDLWKAHEILYKLRKFRDDDEQAAGEGRKREIPLRLELADEKIEDHETGGLTRDTMLSRLLSQAVTRVKKNDKSLIEEIKSLAQSGEFDDLQKWVDMAPDDPDELLSRIAVTLNGDEEREASDVTARLSFVREGGVYRVAAMTSNATVPERIIDLTDKLVRDVTNRATDPPLEEVRELSAFLHGLLVPRDFRSLLSKSSPFVLELDRETAPVPWEMLASDPMNESAEALALERPVARQLRTTYSPAPLQPWPSGDRGKALVIGDPGDPAQGDDLPGARREAIEVAKFLASTGRFDVLLLVGKGGPLPRNRDRLTVGASSYIDVLQLLMKGEYELVHYAGHGDFDPKDPRRAGWLFHDGLLTARAIARVDRAPRIVVANACLSAQSSATTRVEGGIGAAWGEAGLLPSLADEFYHRGVSHYIGTAWEVNDDGAATFSKEFYYRFLEGEPIGEAVLSARRLLGELADRYDALWAAYQHYGDPSEKYKK